jgi:queuine tRNA-ribosyltransferase
MAGTACYSRATGSSTSKMKSGRMIFHPLEAEGEVFADLQYTKAFLRHMFVSKEILAAMIATMHNLGFYIWLMKEARTQIAAGTFTAWKQMMVKKLMQRL